MTAPSTNVATCAQLSPVAVLLHAITQVPPDSAAEAAPTTCEPMSHSVFIWAPVVTANPAMTVSAASTIAPIP